MYYTEPWLCSCTHIFWLLPWSFQFGGCVRACLECTPITTVGLREWVNNAIWALMTHLFALMLSIISNLFNFIITNSAWFGRVKWQDFIFTGIVRERPWKKSVNSNFRDVTQLSFYSPLMCDRYKLPPSVVVLTRRHKHDLISGRIGQIL